jgi:hypothetical protein
MLIDRELLLQEANKRGITQRDDVQEQLEQARLNVLAGAVFEDYVAPTAPAMKSCASNTRRSRRSSATARNTTSATSSWRRKPPPRH